MGDPVLITVVGVGAALTKMFLRACDAASAADLIGDGQELLGTLLRASRRSDGSKDQIERSVSKALAARIQEIHKLRCGQDIDRQLLSGVCTEVEILLDEIANDRELLLSAVLNPDSFQAEFHSRASQRRMNVEERAETYFDELVEAVAAQYAALAPWSQLFQIEALKSILSSNDEIRENSRRSLDAHAVTHDKLDTLSSKLTEVTHREDKRSRILFGSRPDVGIGSSFVPRVEQDQLNELITDTAKQRTVLVGMRGCGKTQLAAALAKQCEETSWSLVAWVKAASPESIKSALVELAKELKIDMSDHPTQEQVLARYLNYLRSSEASDRLVIFDNVEDINDLRGLVPTGDGLRVVATTTNSTGWDSQEWGTIMVGVFDREKSINYLLNTTSSTDHKAADTLAHRLGDLPLALAQAAATARNGDLSLARYLDRLDTYGSERAIRPVPGDYYADDVATALCMAIENALENLAEPRRRCARRQLGALALLAESGVPTRWLDPTIEQQDNQELQGALQVDDEDAHDALTELIHQSIIQQSTDKATTMLHRLQAQAFRESWDENEAAEAYESAATLLEGVDVDKFRRNDAKSRREETLAWLDQLRTISRYQHSRSLFKKEQISTCVPRLLVHADDLGLFNEAITLKDAVDLLEEYSAIDNPVALNSRNNLARAYERAGHLSEATKLYEIVLQRCMRIYGNQHPDTLTVRNNLAGTYREAGRLREAIHLYEQVLRDYIDVLGDEHLDTLTARNNLAGAYREAGRIMEAIQLFEQVLQVRTFRLGEDHRSVFTSRNNLAGAYRDAGRIVEAISLYEQTLSGCIRILGEEHPDTLASRNNLASAYQHAKYITEAIEQFDALYTDCLRILGPNHVQTLAASNNLAGAYRDAGRMRDAINQYEKVVRDCNRILGKDNPRSLTSHSNLAGAYLEAGEVDKAISLYAEVLQERKRILGDQHPDTLTSRCNLAGAYELAGSYTYATNLFEDIYSDCLGFLGPNNPLTVRVRSHLASAKNH